MPSSLEYNRQYRLDHRDDIEASRRERRRAAAASKPLKIKSPQEIETKKEIRKMKKAAVDKAYRERHADEILAKNRTPEKRFKTAKTDAKRRGYEFSLSFDFWWTEVQKTCVYCRDLLGKRSETTVGLDRLDNSKGYLEGNVASCCETCNKIKLDRFSFEETMVMVNALLAHRQG